MIEFYINGQQVEVQIEDEQTVGDVLTSFEKTCERIVPYVLVFALLIFGILLLVVLVKYGHSLTGTESNIYYYHLK